MTEEKDFEEWFNKEAQGAAWYWSKKASMRESWLASHAKDVERIERLREGIRRVYDGLWEETELELKDTKEFRDILQKLLKETE